MFTIQEKISPTELERGLNAVVRDGVTSQVMITLTSGVFLSAFALAMGASNLVIGLLAAIPPLAQLLQIPTIYLVETFRNRKLITLASAVSSRLSFLLIALIPFCFHTRIALTFLVLGLILNSVTGAVGNCSWNSWMRDLIPANRLGSFFSRRLAWAIGIAGLVSLVVGYGIDRWKLIPGHSEPMIYAYIFIGSCLVGLLGCVFIAQIPEPRMESIQIRFTELLASPIRDMNFRNVLIFLGVWNFAVNLAVPFFAVYMLVFMKLSMVVVTALTVLSQVMNVWSFHLWGRFSDRFSNSSVLAVCCPVALMCIAGWTFVLFPGHHILTVPLLVIIHFFFGVAMSGIQLATGNITLKLAPKGQATAYLATSSIITSVATGIAPIIGGACADLFKLVNLSLTINWTSPHHVFIMRTLDLQYWDFFFMFAFLSGLYALHRLAIVKESGSVHERIVWKEFMNETGREMRLFTAGSFNMLMNLPLVPVRAMRKQNIFNRIVTLFRR